MLRFPCTHAAMVECFASSSSFKFLSPVTIVPKRNHVSLWESYIGQASGAGETICYLTYILQRGFLVPQHPEFLLKLGYEKAFATISVVFIRTSSLSYDIQRHVTSSCPLFNVCNDAYTSPLRFLELSYNICSHLTCLKLNELFAASLALSLAVNLQ